MNPKSTIIVLVAALAVLSGGMGMTLTGAFSDQGIMTASTGNVSTGMLIGHVAIEGRHADGELFDYDALKPLLDAFSGKPTLHKGEHSSYKDGLFSEQWMTSQFDLAKPILPEHWT